MKYIRIDRKNLEYLIFTIFVLAGLLGLGRSILTQEVIWVSNGLGWDGGQYDLIFQYFSENGTSEQRANFPFCGRIGTAWFLANFLNGKIYFYEFNLIVSAVFSLVFLSVTAPLWKSNLKSFAAAIAIPNFLFFAPIKLTNFYPVYMDPPFLLILSIVLFFIIKHRYITAAFFCIAAIPFREAAFYIIPLLSAFAVAISENKIRAATLAVIIISAGYMTKAYMLNISGCEGESQFLTAFWWLYRLLTDPTRTLSSLAAISLTLGPLIFLRQSKFSDLEPSKYDTQIFSTFAIFYFGALSFIGGSDVTRIFYSFIPLYAPILILAFGNFDLSGFAMACFGWMLTNQFVHKYEQPISEVPNNDITGFFAQFPDHAHPVISLVILSVWLILSASHRSLHAIENHIFDRFQKNR